MGAPPTRARGDDPDSIGIRVEIEGLASPIELRLDARDAANDLLPVRGAYHWPLEPSALLGAPGTLDEMLARPEAEGPTCHYIAAERLGPRDIHALSRHEVRLRELGSDGSNTIAFLDTHASQVVEPALRRDDAVSPQLGSQVTAWLGEVSPGIRIRTTSYQELTRASLSVSFTSGQATSRRLRPSGVGFGVSYTLPVLVALLASRPGDLVLLENPEAHLHPRGQMAMGDLMARAASAGIQVLCETHSDHVLNGVRLAVKQGLLASPGVALHYFSRTNDGERVLHVVDSPRVGPDGRLDRWPQGFFDQWDIALERLL